MDIQAVLNKLNQEQKVAVIDSLDKPTLVVAGPGAGKCIKGDSIVFTDKGLIRIEDIPKHYHVGNNSECLATIRTVDINGDIYNHNTSHFYNMGNTDTIKVTTSKGYIIEGTKEHPIVVLNKDGDLEFKKLEDLIEDDIIAICISNEMWGSESPFDEDIAYVLGLLCGDGILSRPKGTIGFSNSKPFIYEKYIEIMESHYPNCQIRDKEKKDSNTIDWYFHNTEIKRKFESYGLKMTTAGFKEVPYTIMQGTKINAIRFLQGLFDTDGSICTERGTFEYCSKSLRMATEVQMLLLNLGIVSRIKPRQVKDYPDNYYYIYISGTMLRRFYEIVGFRYEQNKQKELSYICVNRSINDNLYVIYNQSKRLRRIRSKLVGKPYYNGKTTSILNNGNKICIKKYIYGEQNPSCPTIQTILNIIDFVDEDIRYLKFLTDNFYFDTISSIEDSIAVVYDFTVPVTHSFIANGFVNHNTRVLTSRYLYLLSLGIPVSDIMAVTFTNKAATELKERILNNASGYNLSNAFIGTFHSICVRLLRIYGKSMDFDNYTIIDPADSRKIIKHLLEKRGISLKGNEIDTILDKISELKNIFVTPQDFLPKAKTKDDQRMAAAYHDYVQYCRQNKVMDFDDIILNMVTLLERDLSIRQRITNRFKHIMIDEAQDTSLSQHRLINLMIDQNNLFMVGDIDQSLYGWRNAKPQYLAQFQTVYPNGQILELKKNYRSTGMIVKAASGLIQNNLMRYAKEMETDRPDGEKVYVCEFSNPRAEASTIAQNIHILKNKRGYEYKDFVIIYRTKAQSRIFEDNLIKHNVPYKIVNGVQFYERMEIKDLLSYMRVIANPDDNLALARILEKVPRVGKKTIATLLDEAEKTKQSLFSVISGISGGSQAKDNIKDFVSTIIDIQNNIIANKMKISEIIEHIINKFDYYSLLPNDETIDERIENIEEFIRKGVEFDQELGDDERTLQSFIEKLTLSSDQDDVDDDNTVKLMTGHTAKGLEFKVVFIVNAVEGIMPHEKSFGDPTRMEEERRIFFVAMTRAEDLLFISYANVAQDIKGTRYLQKPSRYIDELPKECIKFKQMRG